MSRTLNSIKAYSHKVIPLGWRNISVRNADDLCFLGETNLRQMLAEWQILASANATRLKHLEEKGGSYYSTYDIESIKRFVSDANFGINEISMILPNTEPKPLFATHRSVIGAFRRGEKAFSVLSDDGVFCPVTIIRQDYGQVHVHFETIEDKPSGIIDHDSPLIQKVEELRYLIEHMNYARLYAIGSDIKYTEDIELFLSMLEDCAKNYFDIIPSDTA